MEMDIIEGTIAFRFPLRHTRSKANPRRRPAGSLDLCRGNITREKPMYWSMPVPQSVALHLNTPEMGPWKDKIHPKLALHFR